MVEQVKEIKLSIHSIIDVITNSSSVVYISVHGSTVDKIFGFMQAVLDLSGSDVQARDIFTVEKEEDEDEEEGWDDYEDSDVVIKLKDGSNSEHLAALNNLQSWFSYDCSYNG